MRRGRQHNENGRGDVYKKGYDLIIFDVDFFNNVSKYMMISAVMHAFVSASLNYVPPTTHSAAPSPIV